MSKKNFAKAKLVVLSDRKEISPLKKQEVKFIMGKFSLDNWIWDFFAYANLVPIQKKITSINSGFWREETPVKSAMLYSRCR